MEIIKQGKLNKIEVTCPNCGMIGKIDEGEFVKECPCCGAAVKWGQKTLGIPAAYGYPKYYYHYGKNDGARILDDKEVGELINSTVKRYLESNGGYSFSATGDTHIAVFQNDVNDPNDYTVIVSRGYEEYQTGDEDYVADDE